MKNVRTGTLPVILCLLLLMSVLTGCGGEGAAQKKSLLDAAPATRCAVTKERTYDHSLKLTYADRCRTRAIYRTTFPGTSRS